MLKAIGRSPVIPATLGFLLAAYLKFVWRTSRFTFEPDDSYARIDPHLPVIVAAWHGQNFMLPFFRRPHDDVRLLISRHGDGEFIARATQRLGFGMIRGSGDSKGRHLKKGGVHALRAMLRVLKEGASVSLTADVPKGPARRCGLGIITLARLSGRPIFPVAVTTSRRIRLNSWDKATLNLPFSRGVFVTGEPISVAADADAAALEEARAKLDAALDTLCERAQTLVGR